MVGEKEQQGEGVTLTFTQSPYFRLAALGFVFSMLCGLVFIAGGIVSCKAGGGFYSGYKCIEMNIVDSCESISGKTKGNTYTLPENYKGLNNNVPTNNIPFGGVVID